MNEPDRIGTEILRGLRSADKAEQGLALKRLEPWLKLLARVQMETWLRGKFDPTDVVQETMIKALGAMPRFRGQSQGELLAWLRKILSFVLTGELKRYRAQKRDSGREVSLDEELGATSLRLSQAVPAPGGSPTGAAVKGEENVRLALALERLPDDYREIIVLRNMLSLSHEEAARRMGRSSGAVRMLYVRALAALRDILKEP